MRRVAGEKREKHGFGERGHGFGVLKGHEEEKRWEEGVRVALHHISFKA